MTEFKGTNGRVLSTYQVNLLNAGIALANKESGAIVVDAKAGAAKTSTSVMLMQNLPDTLKILGLCFNKHSADEFGRRCPANVQAMTLNSFGWKACRSAFKGVKLERYKTSDIVKTLVPDAKKQRAWGGAIERLISLKKATVTKVDGKLQMLSAAEILKQYDVEAPTDPEFLDAAAACFKKSINQYGIMDFDDQIFMPVWKGLPVEEFDLVFVDEAQDLSSVQVELLKRIAPRVIAVGDPYQSIYMFRGADPDSMAKMTSALNATVMPLSISYRCPRAVVQEAQQLVPEIEWAPNAAEGIVDEIAAKDLQHQAAAGDWVLCRNTAPLVKECLSFIVAGIKASVKGRDIGAQLVSLIDKVNVPGSDATRIDEFQTKLQTWYSNESARLEAAQRDAQLQALEDRVQSIEALSEGARSVSDVKARISNVFSDEASAGVTFATVHRSKGLEAANIFIIRPDLMPSKKVKSEAGKKQERNIEYVAITRAMHRLAWVTPNPKDLKR